MSTKKMTVRDYNFSDAVLKQNADGVKLLVQRDISQFNTRGITTTHVTTYNTIITTFDNHPTDEETLGNVSVLTEDKDAEAEALKIAIRTFRTMAQNKWHETSAYYRSFGFEGMDEMTDEQLCRLGRRVERVATTHLALLAGEGLTTAMLASFSATRIAFDDAIDAKLDAVNNRDISTETRIEKGNAVYKEMMRLCAIGKDIFASLSEAKFNDYLMYSDSGSSETADDPDDTLEV